MAYMGDNEVNETRSEPRISPVREIMLASTGAFVSIRGRNLLPGGLWPFLSPLFSNICGMRSYPLSFDTSIATKKRSHRAP
jgi:hypothetical protein